MNCHTHLHSGLQGILAARGGELRCPGPQGKREAGASSGSSRTWRCRANRTRSRRDPDWLRSDGRGRAEVRLKGPWKAQVRRCARGGGAYSRPLGAGAVRGCRVRVLG